MEIYGKNFPTDDLQAIELWCYANNPPQGLGRYQHLRNAIDQIWVKQEPGCFIWNDWSEWMQKTFSEHDWVTITGPGASWKTTCASIFCLASFYADPRNTVIICTSTTLDGLRRRIWKEIVKYHRIKPLFGHLIQSRNCIQFRKGSDDAGIFGIATDKGDIEKAIGKIIGFHAPKQIVVVDEMPYTPEAIVEACVNLQSGSKRFQFIGLGNADDHLDPHGRMCEPKAGWESIDVETEQWETRRGICIHLDGLKSPNIRNYGKQFPGMLNQSDIDTTAQVYGVDSPQFWQQRRGFWAPEALQKTVLTMPIIIRGRAREEARYDQSYVMGAALDPAFEGGDRCTLRFGRCGAMEGKNVMSLDDRVVIKTVTSKEDPTHYQILRQVQQLCDQRGVSPFYFALDSTGEGSALASMFEQEWSREICRVDFGGLPSSRPVSPTNRKSAREEYDRTVTELWFFFRLLVQNEQVRGLDEESAIEFCRRWWTMKGFHISLETKVKMRDRTRRSPDYADADVILAELFHRRGSLSPDAKQYPGITLDTPWRRFLLKRNLQVDYAEAMPY